MKSDVKEKKSEVVDSLAGFIVRVASGKATSEAEVAVLPEVVKAFDILISPKYLRRDKGGEWLLRNQF